MNFAALSAPFPADAVHWRAQKIYDRSGAFSAQALAYIDARDVMDRLDEVCGPEGWEDSYVETSRGRVICTISIKNAEGAWVSKSDGAGDTDHEGEKGGISDAFKRAAVKWGIGRYLYRLGNTYVPCEVASNQDGPIKNKGGNFIFKSWPAAARDKFAQALAKVAGAPPAAETVPAAPDRITEAQREDLSFLMEANNIDTVAFLRVGNIKDLRDMPAADFEQAKRWILKNARKAA